MLKSSYQDNTLIFYVRGRSTTGNYPPGNPGDVPTVGDWFYKVTDTTAGYFAKNGAEQQRNAANIYKYFHETLGWNSDSVCALIGNMDAESTLNPGLIEVGGGTTSAGPGRGLVQWTPGTDLTNPMKVVYGSSDDWWDGSKQCRVIYAEFEQKTGAKNWGIEPQWYSGYGYNLTWQEWAFNQLNNDIDYLTAAFCWEYERPGAPRMEERQARAQYWATVFRKG